MRIAVLGWGSLIWSPRKLALASKWAAGPALPVEFARISGDRRVTLVLGGEVWSQCYWALSALDDVDSVCRDLHEREGRPYRYDIHYTMGHGLQTMNGEAPSEASLDVSEAVVEWLDTVPEIEAAMWTGLPPKDLGPVDDKLAARVIEHLQALDEQSLKRAEEYVRFAPETIRTPVRQVLEGPPLEWLPKPLPQDLFEDLLTEG